ncbi:MAG TPA: hypothetical protein VN781_05385 [Acidimicrobiales bacterium]|nr:hypothetical protein [Acidimicrobiales bacterium]
MSPTTPAADDPQPPEQPDPVDEADAQSFPASDPPPGWSGPPEEPIAGDGAADAGGTGNEGARPQQ